MNRNLVIGIVFLFILSAVAPLTLGYNFKISDFKEQRHINPSYGNGNPPEEEWNRTFGGTESDYAYEVQQTSDGGYIIVGYTRSQGSGYEDIWLIKTDANGTMEWNKTFGGFTQDKGYSVQQTSDGGFILVGHTFSYGSGSCDVWLIKTDENGNEQWNKTYGNVQADAGRSVRQTSDGGYIITGFTGSYGCGGLDVWLIKTNEDGVELWNHTWGGPSSGNSDEGSSVEQTPDGGYILTGCYFDVSDFDHDVYLIKTDENGIEEWNHTWGGRYSDFGTCVKVTSDGGCIVSGWVKEGGDHPDAWLIKTDVNGTEQWNSVFGGNGLDWAESVYQTNYGGYILAGISSDKSGLYWDLLLIETDRNGNEIWNKTFGGNGYDIGYSVQQTSDGDYIVAGMTSSYGAGGSDFWLIKVEHFNYPPNPPSINGPPSGKVGKEYKYTFNAIDPDGDDVKYFIDWGDNTTEWTGYNHSGTDAKLKHTWSEKGNYTIKAKAKDTLGEESDWAYLEVTMPKNQNVWFLWWLDKFPLLQWLLGWLMW